MSKRLPSLTALRTFEAAARHLSFAKAATELFVTPAAVGYQIKQLEDELGTTLFRRKHRAVELTERGQILLRDLSPAFRSIHTAWNAAHVPLQETKLRVSGPARAVHNWLLPATQAAASQMPGLHLAWDLSKQLRDVAHGEVDLAVRWAREPEGNLHWEPLLRTWFTPILRPDVARYVQRPKELEKQGLIDVDFVLDPEQVQSNWATWHAVQGLPQPERFEITCADTASAVETALATGHVALAGSFLASGLLTIGTLVAPFETAIAPFSRFWLVCRKDYVGTDAYGWFLSAVRASAKGLSAAQFGKRALHPDGTEAAT
ncbi:LysR family transcriptional regulator [Rhodobacterales bacterium HKCCE4037]|nr:LysR family transcriptional regulator [Rhodobacterales bacterium HKCCE4037]